MPDEYRVGDQFKNEWERIRDKVDGVRGPFVNNSPTAISHGDPQPFMPDLVSPVPNRIQPILLVSVITSQPGRYNAKTISGGANKNASGGLVLSDVGTAASSNNCVAWNLREIGHGGSSQGHAINLSDNSQCVVMAWATATIDQTTSLPIYLVGADPGVTFRVDLTETSGSLGNASSASSWEYTANVPGTSVTLGTSLSPEASRENGTYAAATKGLAYYNASGTLVLYSANEVCGTTSCSS